MILQVNSKAPDFTLKSINAPGEKDDFGLSDVNLEANIGQRHTVILFFPLAFTGVCTQELCDVTSGLAGYGELNADVIAISIDSPFAQGQWAEKESIGNNHCQRLEQANSERLWGIARRSHWSGQRKRTGCVCDRQRRHRPIRGTDRHALGVAKFRFNQGNPRDAELAVSSKKIPLGAGIYQKCCALPLTVC